MELIGTYAFATFVAPPSTPPTLPPTDLRACTVDDDVDGIEGGVGVARFSTAGFTLGPLCIAAAAFLPASLVSCGGGGIAKALEGGSGIGIAPFAAFAFVKWRDSGIDDAPEVADDEDEPIEALLPFRATIAALPAGNLLLLVLLLVFL